MARNAGIFLLLLVALSAAQACGARSPIGDLATSTSTSGAGGAPTCTPAPEICDGLDNNCDGTVDEGCDGCPPGETTPCYTGAPETLDVGVCHKGLQTCEAGGTWGPCVDAVTPSKELCNGLDDDCNGTVDELCVTGCSDGSREGFTDGQMFPQIAACSGGWTVPGVLTTFAPTCGHAAGNSSANPSGNGCSVADLCAPGFHVCKSPADVAAHSPSGCEGAASSPGLFFATRQSSDGCGNCALGALVDPLQCNGCGCNSACAQTPLIANDLFGCGSLGTPPQDGCGVLDRFSNDVCTDLGSPWSCGGNGCNEANEVTKPGSEGGGVLCCAD